MRSLSLAVLAALLISTAAQAAGPAGTAAPKPSENAGKTGSYKVSTANPDYFYWVHVPKTYSDANPAGIYIFFHGQGKGNAEAASGYGPGQFLDKYNLIGIKMSYMDGDNSKDSGGKLVVAMDAVAQVQADYKIIPGRGVISSFSGGGLIMGAYLDKLGKGDAPAFPFSHAAPYSSNLWNKVDGACPRLSWMIGLGTEEWGAGRPNLGTTQCQRAQELFTRAAKNATNPDIYFHVEKGKGHSISGADIDASAWVFGRSDLAFCGFLYAPDYPQKELRLIVAQANALELGKAAAAIDKVVKDDKTPDDVKAKAQAIQKAIDARIDKVMELAKELADDDPALCTYYTTIFTRQLAGHDKAKDLADLFANARKDPKFSPAAAELAAFQGAFAQKGGTGYFSDKGVLKPELVKFLEDLAAKTPEKSLAGKMAADFLKCKE